MAQNFLSQIYANHGIRIDDALQDGTGLPGTAGQILSSNATGVSWIDPSALPAGAAETVEIQVKNTSGGILTKGTPVYIKPSTSAIDRVEVAAADAGDSTKMPAVGLLAQDLNNQATGTAITGGMLTNFTTDPIDGSTPTSNDTVYVKVGGGLTLTKPTGATGLIQNIAKVGKVSGGNSGSLVVSSILRTNDVPNLPTGRIWVGDGNSVASTVVFIDETNGFFGINNATPTAQLDVTGKVNFEDLKLDGELLDQFNSPGANGMILQSLKLGPTNPQGINWVSAGQIVVTGIQENNNTAFIDVTATGLGAGYVTGPVTISAELSAGGTPTSANFLRGDNTWATAVTGLTVGNSNFINLSNVGTATVPDITATLSATGTPTNTTFLRGDNTWAIPAGGGTVTSVNSGTGISVDNTDPDNPIVNNTNPDQTVVLNQGNNITITGTYPNFTIAAADAPAQLVTSVNTQVGAVILDTDDIAEGTNLYFTDARVAANSAVTANTAKLTANTTNVTAAGALMDSEITNLSQVKAFDSSDYLASSVTTITAQQAADIVTNNAKNTDQTVTLTEGQNVTITGTYPNFTIASEDVVGAVNSVNGQVGTVVLDTGDISENGNLYFTEARTSSNADVLANTAARHNAVTLGTANGLSLSSQQISLDLSSSTTNGALSSADWNNFNNKTNNTGTVTSVTVNSGSGLSGSGTVTSTGTITLSHADTSAQTSVDNTGATVIQDVTLDTYGHVTGLASKTITLGDLGYTGATNANYITNNNELINGAGYTTNVGDITGVTAGTGISGGGTSGTVTVALDFNELTIGGTLVGTDYLIAENGGAENRQLISSIPLSIFNNNAGWTSNVGDITGVTAGTNLTGGGTSGSVTLNMATGGIGAGTYGSTANGTKIDNITVDAYGRVTGITTGVTGDGDITGVTAGTNLTGGGTSGTVTLNLAATPSVTGINIGNQIQLKESADRADLLEITSVTSGYAGIQIRNSSNEQRWSLMADGNVFGIYDDENNEWSLISTENAGIALYHNGVLKFETTTAGATLTGDLTVTGGDIVLSGTGRIQGIDTVSASTDAANKAYVDASFSNYNTSVISTSTNASKNTLYVLKANLTLTLPSTPVAGDSIKISNLSGVATCIVARNGKNIMATATNLTLDDAVASFELVYTDATNGWVIIGAN